MIFNGDTSENRPPETGTVSVSVRPPETETETVPVSVSVSGGLVTLSLDSMQARPIGKTGRLSEPWLRAADLLANKLVCQHELGQKQIS